MLSQELRTARANTDALFEIVRPEAFYDRPVPERHRIVFYLGHLEAFDWNLVTGESRTALDRLFAFGIDPDPGGLPEDKTSDWPSLEEVRSYVRRTRECVDRLFGGLPEQLRHVAIEHRLMHAETLAYMLHNLPYARKAPGSPPPESPGREVAGESVVVPGGAALLGRERGDGYGWDNEFDAHEVYVPAFALARYKVTNGQYLRFVEDGGPPPHFWLRSDGGWRYRAMFACVPLPLDAPVYVTHEQAALYAAWRGKRLPSEAEFQRAAYPAAPDPACDNFDFRAWDPLTVTSGRPNRFGAVQMIGNGWEWTSTVFHPFSGFEPFPFYPGYSRPFFDGAHYVLKGASPRTAARLTRGSFRNWFRPAYPYVYATFRLAENA